MSEKSKKTSVGTSAKSKRKGGKMGMLMAPTYGGKFQQELNKKFNRANIGSIILPAKL